MMPDLGLSQLQIGYHRAGVRHRVRDFPDAGRCARPALGRAASPSWSSASLAFVATIATPIVPAFLSGTELFVALYGAQLVLGLSQGAIFPGFRRRIRELVSARSAGRSCRDCRPWASTSVRGLDSAAHRHAQLVARLAAGAHLDAACRRSRSSRFGLGTAAIRRASIHRCRSRSSWRSATQPQAHSSITLRQLLSLVGNRNVLLAVLLLHVHELHLLSALELGVPLSDSRSPFLLARQQLARRGAAAGRRGGRGIGRCRDQSSRAAVRQSLGLSHRAARRDDVRGATAAARGQRPRILISR